MPPLGLPNLHHVKPKRTWIQFVRVVGLLAILYLRFIGILVFHCIIHTSFLMAVGHVLIEGATDLVRSSHLPPRNISLGGHLMSWPLYIKIASISSVIEAIVALVILFTGRTNPDHDSKPEQAGQSAAREANKKVKLLSDHWLFVPIDVGVLSMQSLVGVAVLRYRRGEPVWEHGTGLELGVDGVSYRDALVTMFVGKVAG